jgi:hypothetical protein
MRHLFLVIIGVGVVSSLFTTMLFGGLFLDAGSARSASEPEPAGGSGSLIQGDVDCSGLVDPVDALKELRHDAGLSVDQTEPCADIATVLGIGGYERVIVTDSLTGPDALSKTVDCPVGKKVLGGGVRRTSGSLDSDELNWLMLESFPGTDETTWHVLIQALDTGSRNYEFSAVCADVAQ